jgi:hypothetical protein
MSGFSAEWLALREPYDGRARNSAVLDAVAASVASRTSIAVVDLACGTGATMRAIASRLPSQQSWRLVDDDPDLLARAAPSSPLPDRNVLTVPMNIARDPAAALAGSLDLVTTSALLDLVSADWLAQFALAAAGRDLPVYAALTYDGRVAFEPQEASDAQMIEIVNQHQRRDKGFGPALGPTAAAGAIARFKALGYTVAHGPSDWVFARHDNEMQSAFVAGWAAAARECSGVSSAAVNDWLGRRGEHIACGRSSIRVGHVDFFAQPTTTR